MLDNMIGFHLSGRKERMDPSQLLCGSDQFQNACQRVQSEAMEKAFKVAKLSVEI